LLKSGIKDENLAFFTGNAGLLHDFMQNCKRILFDPPKYTFQKKSDDIELLRKWIEIKANSWSKQLSITGKGNYNVQDQKLHIAKPAIIFTEGKTDWQHLKNAQKKLNIILDIFYHEDIKEIGDTLLLRDCEVYAKVFQQTPLIFIFDRDNPQIINKVSESDKGYKYWGNNVFSFAIPIPDHRRNYENISIEFYYTDNEIATEDLAGRRLFLTSEFDERSGNYKQTPIIHVGNQHKLRGVTKREKSKIVDSDIGVFNMEGQNIALSKAMFIENVGQDIFPFDKFEFEPFRKIFEMIEKILQNTDKDAERVGAPTTRDGREN
jgi:RNA-directed DNA polymerase